MESISPDFLVFLYEPTAPMAEARLFLLQQDSTFSEVGIKDLTQPNREIVTYELAAFIDANTESWIDLPLQIIDIDVALTLAAERPLREREGGNFFSFLEHLQSVKDSEIEPFVSFCYRGERSCNDLALVQSAHKVAIYLRDTWSEVCSRLRKSHCLKRLFNVEVPAARVMYQRQALGIRVDTEGVRHKISHLSKIAARARSVLRKKFSILNPSDRGQVARALEKDPHLAGIIDTDESEWRAQPLLKLYSSVSQLASELRVYREAQRTKIILQRFGITEDGRVHSDFRISGTVTGRILTRNPALQNISSTHRDIIIPDEGKTLLYPDFKQCEPGILAHETKDICLIDDYNTGDLYEGLSKALFGDFEHREPSKLLFLFVCYGMAQERVTTIGSSITGLPETFVERAISEFFSRYSGIEIWRKRLAETVSRKGRIGTPYGNFRSFSANANTGAVQRGAQSQRIQGTAALILKQIIIKIDQRLPEVDVLLPMHDALLVQVPTRRVKAFQSELEVIFCEEYRKYCPTIYPKVSFENFYSND